MWWVTRTHLVAPKDRLVSHDEKTLYMILMHRMPVAGTGGIRSIALRIADCMLFMQRDTAFSKCQTWYTMPNLDLDDQCSGVCIRSFRGLKVCLIINV